MTSAVPYPQPSTQRLQEQPIVLSHNNTCLQFLGHFDLGHFLCAQEYPHTYARRNEVCRSRIRIGDNRSQSQTRCRWAGPTHEGLGIGSIFFFFKLCVAQLHELEYVSCWGRGGAFQSASSSSQSFEEVGAGLLAGPLLILSLFHLSLQRGQRVASGNGGGDFP